MTTLTRTAANAEDPAFTPMIAAAVPVPQVFESIPPANKNLRAFGFESFIEYRLWCLQEGLQDGLGRGEAELRLRLQTTVCEEIAEHHTEERRQIINKLVAGESRWGAEGLKWLKGDAEKVAAFRRLLLHCDRYMDALNSRRLVHDVRHRALSSGLAALAYHHDRWIRPLEEWSVPLAQGGHPRREEQFASLVRHLLARYEVPIFMDSAWFEGVDERGLRQQQWFMHVAQGGNIRDLDTPIQLTKRMAHLFMRAPRQGTIEKNMRWAQVIGMGGSGALASAIIKTRLGRNHENDDFWSTVVLFLVNNAMLDPIWAGPLVDYASNMKYAPRRIVQEGGGVQEAPPPQPNFTMKGRSAVKLLRQVETWHGQLGRERDVVFQSWQPCGVRAWVMEDETEKLGKVRWTVQELLSSWELAAEGRAMNHCVVSYSDQCADGHTAVWSIGVLREGVEERKGVLTVALDIKSQAVTQARGRYNAQPNRVSSSAQAKKDIPSGYFDLLNRSSTVLSEWMQRERLRWD